MGWVNYHACLIPPNHTIKNIQARTFPQSLHIQRNALQHSVELPNPPLPSAPILFANHTHKCPHATRILSHWEHSFTSYDVLTKGAGPACLFLVVLSRGVRTEPSVAVKPAAVVALAALLLEPLFNTYVISGLAAQINVSSSSSSSSPFVTAAGSAIAEAVAPGGNGVFQILARSILTRDSNKARADTASAAALAAAASAMSRACWLTAGAQLALWIAVVVAYARLSLRLSGDNLGDRRSVKSYMKALGVLASKKRGNGGWSRVVGHCGRRALPPNGLGPCYGAAAAGESDTSQSRAHTSSMLGSLYERFARGLSPSGGGTDLPLGPLAVSRAKKQVD